MYLIEILFLAFCGLTPFEEAVLSEDTPPENSETAGDEHPELLSELSAISREDVGTF